MTLVVGWKAQIPEQRCRNLFVWRTNVLRCGRAADHEGPHVVKIAWGEGDSGEPFMCAECRMGKHDLCDYSEGGPYCDCCKRQALYESHTGPVGNLESA